MLSENKEKVKLVEKKSTELQEALSEKSKKFGS
jgi:hypothetical protein